mgnify:FL=1
MIIGELCYSQGSIVRNVWCFSSLSVRAFGDSSDCVIFAIQYKFFLYLPIRQAMKCDGSFVIVINLSISLLYSQAGGFFVLNSPKSKYLGDKK